MNVELENKVKKAESYRKKKAFPLSIFSSPDYFESADLFYEVAKEVSDLEAKEKYFLEAANTYALVKGEYTMFKSADCYKKLFETLQSVNLDKAVAYYLVYAQYLEKMDKHLMAGQAYTKMGDLTIKDKKTSLEYYKKAVASYKLDTSIPYHLKEAYTRVLNIQIDLEDLEGAIETLNVVAIEHGNFAKQILMLLLGKSVTDCEDALSTKESQLIMSIINKERQQAIAEIEDFKNDNFLADPIRKIVDLAIFRFSPENDIC